MAHGVHAPLRIAGRMIAVCEDHAAGAECRADDAGGDDSVSHRARRLIPTAADDWNSRAKIQFRRRRCGQFPRDF